MIPSANLVFLSYVFINFLETQIVLYIFKKYKDDKVIKQIRLNSYKFSLWCSRHEISFFSGTQKKFNFIHPAIFVYFHCFQTHKTRKDEKKNFEGKSWKINKIDFSISLYLRFWDWECSKRTPRSYSTLAWDLRKKILISDNFHAKWNYFIFLRILFINIIHRFWNNKK